MGALPAVYMYTMKKSYRQNGALLLDMIAGGGVFSLPNQAEQEKKQERKRNIKKGCRCGEERKEGEKREKKKERERKKKEKERVGEKKKKERVGG